MKWAPWIIVVYMLAALCWWTYLLYSKNEVIYQQQMAIMLLQNNQDQANIAMIQDDYLRQKTMIVGEGIVFGIALISGIAFLYAAYRKTLKYSQRQNNFLLSVTHELKSPLASIKLAFETIKKRALKVEQNQMISENGITEVDRLHDQVENILMATSIDQQYTVQLQETTLTSLIEEIKIKRHNRPMENRITYSFDGNQNSSFKVDMHGCFLICDNLLGNALKYSQEDVTLNLKKNSDSLEIRVSDHGPGIEEKEHKNIFSRFYRIGNEETRRSKGTGLGLYIVKRIVDKNNGSIQLANNTPTGTIFTIEIQTK